MRSETTLHTENGWKYVQQLCKHFSHKIPAHAENGSGRIDFVFGPVTLRSDETRLVIAVEAADPAGIERGEHVVSSHLDRFAFRETLAYDWQRSGEPAAESPAAA